MIKIRLAILCFSFFLFTGLHVCAQIITTFAGNHIEGFSGAGGPAISAEMGELYGVAADAAGNVYAVDHSDNVIWKVNSAGIISIIAGTGVQGYSGDGGPATAAQLLDPFWIACDPAGDVYFTDQKGIYIRKVNSAGIISTVAGSPAAQYTGGDGGPFSAATFNKINAIVPDNVGNIYITDNHTIRKVNSSGIINTIAGNGTAGFSGDGGPATAALLQDPGAVGFDAAGNIYIPDSYNQRIRKVNTAGIITTVAGTGATGKSGNGGPAIDATFNGPFAVVVDNAGNLYVDDRGNSEIRKIDNTGTITDYAGNGIAGYSGDGGAAVDGEFTYPEGIAIDHSGNCYLADTYNYVIRKVSDCQLPQISQQPANDAVCLGGSATFSVTATNATGYLWGVNSGSGWLPLGDGGIYSGSATSSLSISSVSGAMNDNQYVCEVLSACGTTTTLPVVLTVSSTAPPTLTISASDTTVCSGTPVSFMATPTNGGAAPSYQWLLNGVNTGTNSPTYTDGSPAEGDIVSCALTIPSTCVVNPAAASNAIVMTVNPVPTVALMRDTIIALGQSITLDATVTVGAGGSVASYTWVPAGGLNNPAVEDPVAAPISSTTYQLTVETGAGCTASGKVTIGVFGKFEMPNAFTPNGDGKNDIFRVPPSEAVNVISFAVYNRWAARVFMTTNSGGGWDGTLGGQAQPAGTYVWQIEYRDALTGKSVMVIGTVILVR